MEWPSPPLAAVCVPTVQQDPRESPGSKFRYVDISGVDRVHKEIAEYQILDCAEAPSRARKVIRTDDVLVSTVRPNLNAVAMVPDELDGEIASTGFCVLRAIRSLVEPRYLFYRTICTDFVAALTAKVRGANYPAVSDGDVKGVEIPLPPLSEQRRIVEILDQADRLRRLRTEADAKADRILSALFLRMFGDPATNPMGWEVLPLEKCSEVQGGLQLTSRRSVNPLEVPYLRVANVYRDRLDLSEVKTIRVAEAELNRTRLERGDLLIVEGHGNPREIGRCAIWDGSVDACVHQNHLIRVRVAHDMLTPEFGSAYLNSPSGRLHLLRAGKTTSGLNTISVANVKGARMPRPPLSVQRAFSAHVEEQTTIEVARGRARSLLGCLWTTLAERAFAGELTRCWRGAHMKELLQEMERQAKVLEAG